MTKLRLERQSILTDQVNLGVLVRDEGVRSKKGQKQTFTCQQLRFFLSLEQRELPGVFK